MPRTTSSAWLAAAVLACNLGACARSPVQQPGESSQSLLRLPVAASTTEVVATVNRSAGRAIAAHAQQMVGVPYLYGGKSPRGFDCSGLVYYTHRQAGIDVPRTSRAQLRAARRITLEQARPGDLLFFKSRNYSHVAIYISKDTFVHAPSTGKRVTPASLTNDYYRTHLVAVGRLH